MNFIFKLFIFNEREIVNGYRVIRDKNDPTICYTAPYWWERIGGYRDKTFLDTKHPNFKKKILELAEKCKNIKIEK